MVGVDGVVMMSLSSSSVVDRLALRTFFIDRFLIMFSACLLAFWWSCEWCEVLLLLFGDACFYLVQLVNNSDKPKDQQSNNKKKNSQQQQTYQWRGVHVWSMVPNNHHQQ